MAGAGFAAFFLVAGAAFGSVAAACWRAEIVPFSDSFISSSLTRTLPSSMT